MEKLEELLKIVEEEFEGMPFIIARLFTIRGGKVIGWTCSLAGNRCDAKLMTDAIQGAIDSCREEKKERWGIDYDDLIITYNK